MLNFSTIDTGACDGTKASFFAPIPFRAGGCRPKKLWLVIGTMLHVQSQLPMASS